MTVTDSAPNAAESELSTRQQAQQARAAKAALLRSQLRQVLLACFIVAVVSGSFAFLLEKLSQGVPVWQVVAKFISIPLMVMCSGALGVAVSTFLDEQLGISTFSLHKSTGRHIRAATDPAVAEKLELLLAAGRPFGLVVRSFDVETRVDDDASWVDQEGFSVDVYPLEWTLLSIRNQSGTTPLFMLHNERSRLSAGINTIWIPSSCWKPEFERYARGAESIYVIGTSRNNNCGLDWECKWIDQHAPEKAVYLDEPKTNADHLLT